jgi:hypothetical protein
VAKLAWEEVANVREPTELRASHYRDVGGACSLKPNPAQFDRIGSLRLTPVRGRVERQVNATSVRARGIHGAFVVDQERAGDPRELAKLGAGSRSMRSSRDSSVGLRAASRRHFCEWH